MFKVWTSKDFQINKLTVIVQYGDNGKVWIYNDRLTENLQHQMNGEVLIILIYIIIDDDYRLIPLSNNIVKGECCIKG